MAGARGDERGHPWFARAWTRLAGSVPGERLRAELLEGLSGRVLEVGAGDGRNFAHYPPQVSEIVAVEPEPHLRRAAERAGMALDREIRVIAGTAESLPVPDAAFDAAVVSLVLCSVSSQGDALRELRRALVAEGELRFLEHVEAQAAVVRVAQHGLDRSGVWPALGGGCHLSRDTLAAIAAAGFVVEEVRRVEGGPVMRAVPFLLGRARA